MRACVRVCSAHLFNLFSSENLNIVAACRVARHLHEPSKRISSTSSKISALPIVQRIDFEDAHRLAGRERKSNKNSRKKFALCFYVLDGIRFVDGDGVCPRGVLFFFSITIFSSIEVDANEPTKLKI